MTSRRAGTQRPVMLPSALLRARAAYAKTTSVTLAPSVPGHTTWMPHPRRMNNMAGTSPYPPGGPERWACITSHGSVTGAQQHQEARLWSTVSGAMHALGEGGAGGDDWFGGQG